jgi:hypothetical protein
MNSNWETPLALAVGIALVAGVVLLVQIMRAGKQMRASGGPGIVPFELAESHHEANRFLRTWGPRGRAAARRSIAWDFGFIACYVVGLGAAALYVGARAHRFHYGWLETVEIIAAVLAAVAGVLDYIENFALLSQLRAGDAATGGAGQGGATSGRVLVSRWCAQVKFALVEVAGLAILIGFGIVQLAG